MTTTEARSPGLAAGAVTAVAAGGALGSVGRHVVGVWLPHSTDEFPWSTLLVNLSGSLAMGLLVAWLVLRPGSHHLMRPFLGVGVLGGWTTFSALAVESVGLLKGGAALTALLYIVCTFALGVAAVFAGIVAGERLLTLVSGPDDGSAADEGHQTGEGMP
ncbi:MAG TPA: CrcB family protein [Phycicoccus sp.]|nr:CrcB family protein [Phycicoccus sp.]